MSIKTKIERLEVQAGKVTKGKRPFELPSPTLEDAFDLVRDLRSRMHDYQPWFKPDHFPPPQAYMIATRDELAEWEAILEDIRIESGIPQPEWNVMIGDTPSGDAGIDEWRAIRDRLHRWRPRRMGTAVGNIPVYTLAAADGRYINLTFEDGQWWQHDGYPYSIFDE